MLELGSCSQNPPYDNAFPCTNAFDPSGDKFTHTNHEVGANWSAEFGGLFLINRVRILNRKSCCGSRLAGTEVSINGQVCGLVEDGT